MFHFMVHVLIAQEREVARHYSEAVFAAAQEIAGQLSISEFNALRETVEFFTLLCSQLVPAVCARALRPLIRYGQFRAASLKFQRQATFFGCLPFLTSLLAGIADDDTNDWCDLLTFLTADPFLFSALKPSARPATNLLPVSLVIQSDAPVSMVAIRGYALLFLPLIEAFLVFESFRVTSHDDIVNASATLFEFASTGPTTRDAFVVTFGHFLSSDGLRYIFDTFTVFTTKAGLLRARSLAAAAILAGLDGECFPSHVRLVQGFQIPVSKVLSDIISSFRTSPFTEKDGQVLSLYVDGAPIVSPLRKSFRSSRQIWAQGKVIDNPLPLLSLLGKELHQPAALLAFLQLGLAVFTHMSLPPLSTAHLFEMCARPPARGSRERPARPRAFGLSVPSFARWRGAALGDPRAAVAAGSRGRGSRAQRRRPRGGRVADVARRDGGTRRRARDRGARVRGAPRGRTHRPRRPRGIRGTRGAPRGRSAAGGDTSSGSQRPPSSSRDSRSS
jgi:hypothetical protein